MIFVHLAIFIISFYLLAFSSSWLVKSLIKVAKFLGWKEFVVAFFTMAFAGAVPNFSVGLSSVFHGIPVLAFSEITGGNIIDLTLAVALAALVAKRGGLKLPSRTVQGSAIFTLLIAILPLFLTLDGTLNRIDGFLLISAFAIYVSWLFGKKERFSKVYNHIKKPVTFKRILKNVIIFILAIMLLLFAAEGIVRSVTYFSDIFVLPVTVIGILVVGLGNALPEIFFGVQAARKGKDWLVVGNLMGAIIITASLVLGLVAIASPIRITDFSPFLVARFFLIVSAVFFLLFVRTGRKIVKREALILLALYFLFILGEILFGVN